MRQEGVGGRRGPTVTRRVIALALAVAGAWVLSAPRSEARCVTVGADGVSHTQCDLP